MRSRLKEFCAAAFMLGTSISPALGAGMSFHDMAREGTKTVTDPTYKTPWADLSFMKTVQEVLGADHAEIMKSWMKNGLAEQRPTVIGLFEEHPIIKIEIFKPHDALNGADIYLVDLQNEEKGAASYGVIACWHTDKAEQSLMFIRSESDHARTEIPAMCSDPNWTDAQKFQKSAQVLMKAGF